jgi:hypothetical protein
MSPSSERLSRCTARCLTISAWLATACAPTRSATIESVRGCWHLQPSGFDAGESHVDPGQTKLPEVIELDTVPGQSLRGDNVGRRIRTIRDGGGARYPYAFYLLGSGDSVHVHWTSGFIGLTLELRVNDDRMRGTARVWTDYGGGAEAKISLQRVVCPTG